MRCDGILMIIITGLLLTPQWKNTENRSTFGEVMGKSRASCFLTHGVEMFRTIDSLIIYGQSLVKKMKRNSTKPEKDNESL